HDRSISVRKQRFLLSLLDDPIESGEAWSELAGEFGLDPSLAIVPVLVFPAYSEAVRRYGSKETYHFAAENIAAELLAGKGAMFSRDGYQVVLLQSAGES